MKITILLTTTLFFMHQGFTKELDNELSYTSELGNFKVQCQKNKSCQLSINGLVVPIQFPHTGNAENLISEYSDKNKGLYLLKLYHGDGCPNMYRLLHLLIDEKHYISEPFGNCNELNDFSISLVKHQATIQFPAFLEANRKSISYKYSFTSQKLEQRHHCD